MRRKHAHHVIVHNVSEEDQQEDEADLYEALLEGEAEIATADPFQGKQKYVPAIKDGDGQEVQDAQVHTDQNHQRNHRQRSLSDGFASGARNPHRALKLPDRNTPAEEFSHYSDGLLDALAGHYDSIANPSREGSAAVGGRVKHGPSYLISGFAGFRDALLRRHVGMDQLTLALHIKFYGFPVRAAHALPELSPIFDALPIHSADDVAFFESGAFRWSSGGDFVEDRRKRGIAEDALQRHSRGQSQLHVALGPRVVDFQFQWLSRSGLFEGFLGLLPRRISDAIDGKEFVSHLQRARLSYFVCRQRHDLHGQIIEGRVRQPHGDKQCREQQYGKNQIDGWTGKGNQRSLPAWLAHQLVGSASGSYVVGINFGQILSGHAHVAAKRQRAHAVVRCSAFPSKQPRSEADGEDIHPHAQEARHDEVAPLVDHDHQAQHEGDAQ